MIRTNPQRSRGYYTRYFAHYAKKNYILLALGGLFIAGIAVGAVLIDSAGSDTLNMLFSVVNGFIEGRRGQTLLHNIFTTASSSLTFIAILFVCGFCAISQPLTVLLPFFRGLGFGFSAASLYAAYGTRAAGFIAIFIMPDMLISSFAIMLCARESLRFSGNFWSMLWGAGEREVYPLRIFAGRYVAAVVLCVFSAFLEAVLYYVFANFYILG